MTYRVEAREDSADKDYVSAVQCSSADEAKEVASQWRRTYPVVNVTTTEEGDLA